MDAFRRFVFNPLSEIRAYFQRHPGLKETAWLALRWAVLIVFVLLSPILVPILFQVIDLVLVNLLRSLDLAALTKLYRDVLDVIIQEIARLPWDLIKFDKARYMLPPLAAVVFITLSAAFYIRDIYGLAEIRHAFRFIMASVFGWIFYPKLVIDGGEKKIPENEINLLDEIGGPGFLIIEPGNAAILMNLRSPSRVGVNKTIYMTHFETIGLVASLEDQQTTIPEYETQTLDGLIVVLKDIKYRYRVVHEGTRSLDNPYPHSLDALLSMAFNQAVNDQGPVPWQFAVNLQVKTGITEYINSHTIDFLTAPRQDGQDPRRDILEQLRQRLREGLRRLGAELLWIDVGHFAIKGEEVGEIRVNLWATEWIGRAEVARASADAWHQSNLERGRAEGQAQLLMSIMQSLKDIDANAPIDRNMRNIILVRVSQILDAMRDTRLLHE